MGTAFRGFGNPAGDVRHRVAARRAGREDGHGPAGPAAPELQLPMGTTSCGAEICGCAMTECMVAAAEGIEWEQEEGRTARRRPARRRPRQHGPYRRRRALLRLQLRRGLHQAVRRGHGDAHHLSPGHGPGLRTRPWPRSPPRSSACSLSDINVMSNDTDLTPYDLGSWGSRATLHGRERRAGRGTRREGAAGRGRRRDARGGSRRTSSSRRARSG